MQLTAFIRFLQQQRPTNQMLLAMKFTALLLFIVALHASARSGAQEISLSEKNASLEKIFKKIKEQTGYLFWYENKSLEGAKPVTIQVKDASLEAVLATCFQDQPLSYTIVGKTIVVRPKDNEPKKEDPPPLIDIRGRVTQEAGQPVPGATVKVKGTTNATATDKDGYFTLTSVDENATLIITGVTIDTREIKLSGQTNIAVTVKRKITEGEEVLISAGYYSTTDKKRTGNITRITAKDIERQPVTSPLMALQGRVPGLEITPLNGIPGSAPSIRIRGQNSLRNTATENGNLPLYVIDGVPVDSRAVQSYKISGFDPLGTIDPNAIESIEVLKDADATAIYGSRGANGVILITTKKGVGTGTNIEINTYTGFGKIVSYMDMLNTEQYLKIRNEAFANAGTVPGFFDYDVNGTWDPNRYTDWQDVLLGGTASIHDLQVGITGGNANTSFRLGGGYHKENTIYPGDFGHDRLMGNFSLNHIAANQKFKAGLSINYGATENKLYGADIVNSAITLPPNAPALYANNGELNWEIVDYLGYQIDTWFNPLANLLNTHDVTNGNLIVNGTMGYELAPGLHLKTSMGFTDFDESELLKFPLAASSPTTIYPTSTARSALGRNKRSSWIVEPQINFFKNYKGHQLNIILGATWQKNRSEYQSISGEGYVSDVLLNTLQGATSTTILADEYSEYKYTALFARIGYDFKDKYLLNLTGRRDGSSRFGENRQYGNFGAIGMAWVFSNENFIRDHMNFLSFGKFRSSYGITGSDQIGDYKFYDTYNISNTLYQGGITLSPTGLFNPDYSWEATTKFESALELRFFDDILLLEAAWYRNRSSNQLINYQLPVTTGFDGVFKNFEATVENSGWEFLLSINSIKGSEFTWTTSANISTNKNKLVAFPDIENSTYANRYKIDEPLSIRLLYVYDRVDPSTGKVELIDINKDGKIDGNDRQLKSPTNRQYYGGINNIFRYKSFELSFLVQFTKQNVFGYQYGLPGYFNSNLPIVVLDRWQNAGDLTNTPRPTKIFSTINNQFNTSDYYVTDASFIRLKTLSLSYSFPKTLLKKIRIQQAQTFIQGQNLLTFKGDYVGFDPETGTSLPPLRIITLGLKIIL